VSDQLAQHGINSDVHMLRANAVSFLKDHAEFIDEDCLVKREYKSRNDYLEKQSIDGHWCDEIILRALADHYTAEIRILHNSGHVTVISPTGLAHPSGDSLGLGQAKMILELGHISEMHYVSLRRPEVSQTDRPTASSSAATEFGKSPTSAMSTGTQCTTADSHRDTETGEEQELPDYINAKSWRNWCSKRKWLGIKGKKAICHTCITVNREGLGTMKSRSQRVESAFLNGVVAKNRKKLMNKLDEHATSASHIACEHILLKSSEEALSPANGHGGKPAVFGQM